MSKIILEKYTPDEEIFGEEKNALVRFEINGEATTDSLLEEFERFCLAMGYQKASIEDSIIEKARTIEKN